MNKKLLRYLLVVLVAVLLAGGGFGGQVATPTLLVTNPQTSAPSYGHSLRFEPNVGQFHPGVLYHARGKGYSLYLTAEGAVMQIGAQAASASHAGAVLAFQVQSGNQQPTLVAGERRAGVSNYLLGNDPTLWRTGVASYASVTYQGVYPGINLTYYEGTAGNLEYDFGLAVGADPAAISLKIAGAERVEMVGGDLLLHTAAGLLRQPAPTIYQQTAAGRREVAGGYQLHADGSLGFAVLAYDRSQPLVIDPQVELTTGYVTYLGGSGDSDSANAVAVDAAGNAYVTGVTTATNFITTTGALQPSNAGSRDSFITKFSPTGTLLYSTYLGGGGNDTANSIAVDVTGTVYVVGTTTSSNFPTVGQYQTNPSNSNDIFLSRLNSSGTALLYSTYLGSTNGGDSDGLAVAVGGSGLAYLTGSTYGDSYPTSNQYQTFQGPYGNTDAVVSAINTTLTGTNSLLWSTYLAGDTNSDFGRAVTVDTAGNVYVTGDTASTNFPLVGAYQSYQGSADVFVSKLNYISPTLTLAYSSYLGGTDSYDVGRGIAADSAGNAYVAGFTASANFPTRNPYQVDQGGTDAFLSRLNTTISGTGSLIYSTYLGGGTSDDLAFALALDTAANPYLTGLSCSTDFPTRDPYQAENRGGCDAFVSKFNYVGSSLNLAYSTYLGGNGTDRAFGIGLDAANNAYIVGDSQSTNLTTTNALSPTILGNQDAFVARLNNPPPATPTPTRTATSTPLNTTTSTPTLTASPSATVSRTATGIVSTATATATGSPASSTPTLTGTTTLTGTVIPTSTATLTGTATSTLTATATLTGTPTATATPCTISFTDVPTSNLFYADITFLACRGVISGFTGGSFQPNANTSRGQFAKVTTLGFALPSFNPLTPTFSDVPTSSVFYGYVESAAQAGAITGFTPAQCVGAGTPVTSQPCFRPNQNVTRAQVAIIVQRSRGYAIASPAVPTFADVPSNNFAYAAIETLAARGIINGAACTSGGSTLCFRPNDNIRRGELSKVVRRAIEALPLR